MKAAEFVQKLNSLKLKQASWDFTSSIPDAIWEEYFSNDYTIYEFDIYKNIEKNFETAILVFGLPKKFGDSIFGVRVVIDIFDETEIKNLNYTLNFFEMEEVCVFKIRK